MQSPRTEVDFRGILREMHPERSYPTYVGNSQNEYAYDSYDNSVEAMSRAMDQHSSEASRRSSLFLHKLDPTYKNHVRRHQQRKQELIQTILKLSYMVLALATIFGFGCMIVSQKLVTYSNLSSTTIDKLFNLNDDQPVMSEESGDVSSKAEDNEEFSAPKSRNDLLFNFLSTISPSTINVRESPQNRALQWIINSDPLKLPAPTTEYERKRILQRYVLATFFFSAGGERWSNKYGFLSERDECDWNTSKLGFPIGAYGCNDENEQSIAMLALWNNNLLGTIPTEIAKLSQLKELSLFDNQLNGEIPSELEQLSNIGKFATSNVPHLIFNP